MQAKIGDGTLGLACGDGVFPCPSTKDHLERKLTCDGVLPLEMAERRIRIPEVRVMDVPVKISGYFEPPVWTLRAAVPFEIAP